MYTRFDTLTLVAITSTTCITSFVIDLMLYGIRNNYKSDK